MQRVVLPCRFVLHSGYDSRGEIAIPRSHIDCFVAQSGLPLLITYEIELIAVEWIKSGLKNQEVIFRAEGAKPEAGAIGAIRKGDHRALYWSFEGLVSGGRGRVEQLGYGSLSLPVGAGFPEQIWLSL